MSANSISTSESLSEKQFVFWTWLIVGAGLALRLTDLGFSYSNDELSALSRVRFDSFRDLVDNGFYVDGHPGGIQVFLFYWVKLFGMSEWAVRLPFALSSGLGIWFSIRVFRLWFGNTAGLLTGASVALLAFPLLFSQIARPYGSGLTFSMIMLYYWTRLLFDDKSAAKSAFLYSIFAAACMYNHYFSFLLALIVGITGLFYIKRRNMWLYLGAGFLAALLFSPHIYITLNHLSIGGVGLWLAPPSWSWPALHVLHIFNESLLLFLFVFLIVLAQFFFRKTTAEKNRYRLLALIFFLLPLTVGFFYSRYINPVLQHSVLLFSFPFLPALFFSFSDNFPRKWASILVVSVVLAFSVHTIFGFQYFKQQHFGEFRGVAEAIEKWSEEYHDDGITAAVAVNNPWYLHFYMKNNGEDAIAFSQTDNRGGADLDSLKQILDRCSTPFFIYAWTKPVPPEINDMLLARFPCMSERINFGGLSEAAIYSREHSSACINAWQDTLWVQTKVAGASSADTASIAYPEYYPGFEGHLTDILPETDSESQLVAIAEVAAGYANSGALLVADFQDENGTSIHWVASKFDLFVQEKVQSRVRLSLPLKEKNLFHKKMKLYVWNPKRNSTGVDKVLLILEKQTHGTHVSGADRD